MSKIKFPQINKIPLFLIINTMGELKSNSRYDNAKIDTFTRNTKAIIQKIAKKYNIKKYHEDSLVEYILRYLVRIVKKRGYDLVLIEAEWPKFLKFYKANWSAYEEVLKNMVLNHGIDVWNRCQKKFKEINIIKETSDVYINGRGNIAIVDPVEGSIVIRHVSKTGKAVMQSKFNLKLNKEQVMQLINNENKKPTLPFKN